MEKTVYCSTLNIRYADGRETESQMTIATTPDLALLSAMKKRGGSYTKSISYYGKPFYIEDRNDGVFVTVEYQEVKTMDDNDLGEYVYVFYLETFKENPHYESEHFFGIAADREAGMEYAHKQFPNFKYVSWGNRDPILTNGDGLSITAQKVKLYDNKHVTYDFPSKKSFLEELFGDLGDIDGDDLI